MKKILLLLLSLLLLLPLCAQAVTSVPSGVTEVGDEAFAGTAIDALILPASVQTVGANVLSGCNASYLYLHSASTALSSGANNGVPFVFAPSGSAACSLSGFYATETLKTDSGLYYSVTDTALPLCAKAAFSLSGSVTIPKLLDGVPVTTLEKLYLSNTGLNELRVPRYLTIPHGLTMTVTPYQTLFVTQPVANVTETPAGRFVNWTTTIEGDYGAVTYIWRFLVNGVESSLITAEPTVRFAPMEEGSCTVTVTAIDALNDEAVSAQSEAVTVTAAQPVYRALLVGNTYSGEGSTYLPGCDHDVMSFLTVLNSMSGTRYQVTTALEVASGGITNGILTTFADAQPADVSLFYFSGHGRSDGSLVGKGGTVVSVWSLRNALQKIPGTKIVILDCCYSGMAINKSADGAETSSTDSSGLSSFNNAVIGALAYSSRSSENLADQGYIVLTACRKEQLSETVNAGNSVFFGAFTYGLCYGSGYDEWQKVSLGYLPADTNGDGRITMGEAYNGARERVAYLKTMIPELVQEAQCYGDTSFVLWSK